MCIPPSCKLAATRHFVKRYFERGIYSLIRNDELECRVSQAFSEGEIEVDERHRGVEGPRYRVLLDLQGGRVMVICEKTGRCFKLITAWRID
ncbi:MAG: hypothetical protein DRK00_08545 [Thermoprotei archaeon]|nr:MAG: hypothetical protein DRK00_08545 [Thermoprotei archaeon]